MLGVVTSEKWQGERVSLSSFARGGSVDRHAAVFVGTSRVSGHAALDGDTRLLRETLRSGGRNDTIQGRRSFESVRCGKRRAGLFITVVQ